MCQKSMVTRHGAMAVVADGGAGGSGGDGDGGDGEGRVTGVCVSMSVARSCLCVRVSGVQTILSSLRQ